MTTKSIKLVTAKESRSAAKVFNYGNIASVLIPFPLFIFWFGASMFVYALHRHHPNPKVGYFTQKAAYHYYAMAGLLVPVLTFAPGDFFINYWWLIWGGCAIFLIPISIREILRVNREDWKETEIKDS